MQRVLFPSIVLLAFGCATQRWTATGPAPKAETFLDAGSVTLLDEDQVHFVLDKGAPVVEVTEHRIVALLRESGRRQVALDLGYVRGLIDVVSVAGRVTNPDGTTREFSLKDMSDQPAESGILYDDSHTLWFAFPSIPPGAVVESFAVLRYRNPNLHQIRHVFASVTPTLQSRLEVVVPKGWAADYASFSGGARDAWAPVTSATEAGEARLVWEKKDLKPWVREVRAPSPAVLAPSVAVRLAGWTVGSEVHSAFRSPEELSAWTFDLFEKQWQPTPELEALAKEVVAGAPDDAREKAARLYGWVQANVRYVAIEIGMGSWQPHRADEVLKARYGDCKDKATLLKTLLASVGIGSRIALVHSHEGMPLPFALPTVSGNFNHAILAVDLPGGTVLADPTTRAVPFGELPASDQDTDVLPLTKQGSALLPPSAAQEEGLQADYRLAFDERGSLGGEFDLSVHGDGAHRLRQLFLTAPQKVLKERLARWSGLHTAKVDGVLRNAPAGTVTSALRTHRLLSSAGALRLLKTADLFVPPVGPFVAETRSSPVVFPERTSNRWSVHLKLPPGKLHVDRLPAPISIDDRFGAYSATWTAEGTGLELQRTFRLKERIIAPADYPAFKGFVDQVLRAEMAAVRLSAGGAR